MGAFQSNYRRDYQEIVNNFTVKSKQICSLTTKSEASNNVVIVDHTNIKGDFEGVTLTASTDGSCVLVNSIQEITEGMLKDISSQSTKAATDLFGDFSINSNRNVSDVKQSQVNNLTNIYEGTCSSSQISSTNNNFVYVTDTNIGGNFHGITNKTDNKLTCTLTNMAKASSYNQATSHASQTASVKGIAATIIVGVVIMVIVIWVGYYAIQAVSKLTYKQGKYVSVPDESDSEDEDDEEEGDDEEVRKRDGKTATLPLLQQTQAPMQPQTGSGGPLATQLQQFARGSSVDKGSGSPLSGVLGQGSGSPLSGVLGQALMGSAMKQKGPQGTGQVQARQMPTMAAEEVQSNPLYPTPAMESTARLAVPPSKRGKKRKGSHRKRHKKQHSVYIEGTPKDPESLTSHVGKSFENYSEGIGKFIGSPEGQKAISNAAMLMV